MIELLEALATIFTQWPTNIVKNLSEQRSLKKLPFRKIPDLSTAKKTPPLKKEGERDDDTNSHREGC